MGDNYCATIFNSLACANTFNSYYCLLSCILVSVPEFLRKPCRSVTDNYSLEGLLRIMLLLAKLELLIRNLKLFFSY